MAKIKKVANAPQSKRLRGDYIGDNYNWNITNPNMRNIDFFKTLKTPDERGYFLYEISKMSEDPISYDDLYMELRKPVGYEGYFHFNTMNLEYGDVIYFKNRLWYVLDMRVENSSEISGDMTGCHLVLMSKDAISVSQFDNKSNGIFWEFSSLYQSLNTKLINKQDKRTIYYPSVNIEDDWLDMLKVDGDYGQGIQNGTQILTADNGDVAFDKYFYYDDVDRTSNSYSSYEINAKIQIFSEYSFIVSNYYDQQEDNKLDRYFLPKEPCWTLTPASYDNIYIPPKDGSEYRLAAMLNKAKDPNQNPNYKFVEKQVMVLNPDGTFIPKNVTDKAGVRPVISLNVDKMPPLEKFVLMPGRGRSDIIGNIYPDYQEIVTKEGC